jgi:hypothetical protein
MLHPHGCYGNAPSCKPSASLGNNLMQGGETEQTAEPKSAELSFMGSLETTPIKRGAKPTKPPTP